MYAHTQFYHFLALVALLFAISSTAAFVVTGVSSDINRQTGERPARQDVVKMQKGGEPAWDLYLLALQALQQKNQTEQFSWFQMAGIHGFPQIPWDDVEGIENPPQPGYAPHAAITFGPWHRIYLAAYEQVLSQLALEIAAQYPADQQMRYQQAASALRIPFWDWALSSTLPGCITSPTIVVNTPQGRRTIINPLVAYTFHPIPGDDLFPSYFDISHAPATTRNPTDDGTSQIAMINRILTGSGKNFRDQLYNLLTTQTEYAPFSNTGFRLDLRNGAIGSLEGIHNTIHALVSGHMGQVPFSAFDPLFFLHHANIDRLLAIWAAMNPDSYVTPQGSKYGTYTIPNGSIEDAETPLKPFRKDAAGNFHTSTTARSTSTFGYTYPEVSDWNVAPAQLAANVRSIVNALYGPTASLANRTDSRIKRRGYAQPREWFVNFSVKRNVGTAVAVHLFFGEPPAQPENWSSASNLIVSQLVLPSMLHSGMDPPTAMAQVPLSQSLVDAQKSGKLNNNDVGSLIAFLKGNLQWRVQTMTGQVLDAKQLTDLKISIVDREVVRTSNKADQFHQYGKFNEHPELQWGNS